MRSWGRRWRRGAAAGAGRGPGCGDGRGVSGSEPPAPCDTEGAPGPGVAPKWERPRAGSRELPSAEGPDGARTGASVVGVGAGAFIRSRGRTGSPAHPAAEGSQSWERAPSVCAATSGVFPEVARKLRYCGELPMQEQGCHRRL